MKALLKKADDPYLALLTYRSTPLEQGYSPAELLSRRIRTTVPAMPSLYKPKVPDEESLRDKDKSLKERQKRNFDTIHRAFTDLPRLIPGEKVWIPNLQKKW